MYLNIPFIDETYVLTSNFVLIYLLYSRGQMMYDTDSECGNAAPLTLHYGNHHVYLMAEIQQAGDEHSDMELMCEQGATIRAHSLVLASVSPLVRRLLKEDNVCMYHNLVLQFPEIKESHMKTVLDFIYTGQASVLVSVMIKRNTRYCK